MVQQGQVFELTRCGRGGERLWAYRYRTGGRGSRRVQRGGPMFSAAQAASSRSACSEREPGSAV